MWGKGLTPSQILDSCRYAIVPAPFVEKTIPSLLNCLGIFVENKLTIKGFISGLSLISMSVLMPVQHCLDFCSFIVHCETGKYKSFNYVLFQNRFGPSRAFAFPYKFQDQPVNFCQKRKKKSCWVFDMDCFESVDQFRENHHLDSIAASIPQGYLSHLYLAFQCPSPKQCCSSLKSLESMKLAVLSARPGPCCSCNVSPASTSATTTTSCGSQYWLTSSPSLPCISKDILSQESYAITVFF